MSSSVNARPIVLGSFRGSISSATRAQSFADFNEALFDKFEAEKRDEGNCDGDRDEVEAENDLLPDVEAVGDHT